MWWWIEPMFNTGIIFGIIDVFFIYLVRCVCDDYRTWTDIVAIVLLIPILVGVVGLIINGLWCLLVEIWKPYL